MASAADSAKLSFFCIILIIFTAKCSANDILGCGGFVKSHVKLDFTEIEIGLYTKEGILKEKTECAPTNGYYFLPLYEKGDYVLRVHPPAGLSFEPSEVELSVDGETDRCSTGQDINFSFSGFGINGKVVTAGLDRGPSGVSVQLVNEKGEKRNTVTSVGGEFHFTAVIPGKYIVKASHPKWKLEPSQVEVQMKEGKMAPVGVVLTVKGYDVSGSVLAFGSPVHGMYVLLYAKVDPKFRVEGCNTALLQGVPDSPICHVTTDSSGEFTFGLVPAGEYRLVALANTPGKPGVTYNVRPDAVPFTVRHDSLYIRNAFEVTGFSVVGTVEAKAGKGLSEVRVLLDGTPVGNSDAEGKYTLSNLLPGTYTVSFEHEECKIEDIQVTVENNRVRMGVARAGLWRVCGAAPGGSRGVALWRGGELAARPAAGAQGEWCTYLPPGVYTAKVEVSEQEQREGIQFYPPVHKVTVSHGPIKDITFSQLKAEVSGTVECDNCDQLTVTLRSLSPDGNYMGQPVTTVTKDRSYRFSDVAAGSVEVSIEPGHLCWEHTTHRVMVSRDKATVPPFKQVGYAISVHSSHEVEVEYSSAQAAGSFPAAGGRGAACLPAPGAYTLTPAGCHRFSPPQAAVAVGGAGAPPTVQLVATAHATTVHVSCPEPDLRLTVARDDGAEAVGPLAPTTDHPAHYVHTLYLAEGETATVTATSSSLVFQPAAAAVVGQGRCAPRAAHIRGARGLTLRGQVSPPRAGYTVALLVEGEGEIASMVTSSDGQYRFGPLDAARQYRVEARRESYSFSEPDGDGHILAQKLAEIFVHVIDDADEKPLQGALVSVSGDSYRRNVAAGAGGAAGGAEGVHFPALPAGQYYVRPHMREYRFTPPAALVHVREGRTHTVTLRGQRVAWSCSGRVVSLGGAPCPAAAVLAAPIAPPTAPTAPAAPAAPACRTEEATADAQGHFRIRGLLPQCEYKIQLKESSVAGQAGLRLARAPASLSVRDKRDITDVTVVATAAAPVTEVQALVRAAPPHYRTLRLQLAPASAHTAHTAPALRLDAAGYTATNNPGVLYVLPRLPADNKTYVLKLESSLARSAGGHDLTHYFTSDGQFKHIVFEFVPKIKSTEQELRHSSLLLIPVIVAALVYKYRAWLHSLVPQRGAGGGAGGGRGGRGGGGAGAGAGAGAGGEVLDAASIDHILNAVNAAGKRPSKKQKAA